MSGPGVSMSQIVIDGITGSYYLTPFNFGTISGAGVGFQDITVRNARLSIVSQSVATPGGSIFNQAIPHSNLKFQDVTFQNLLASGHPAHQFNFSAGTYDRLEFSGLSIVEGSLASETATPDPPILISGGTFTEIDIRNATWLRTGNTAVSFIVVSGGTINRMNLGDVMANFIANIVSITGGTFTQINSTGLCHAAANGNPSIAIASGQSLGSMRASGSDTAQLVGGLGSIGLFVTDHTEISGGGESVFSAIADPPYTQQAAGVRWYSSAAGGPVTCRFLDASHNLLNTMDDGTFFKCTSCTALSNFTTAASLLGSPTSSWGSLTIPNGALRPGQIIELDFFAICSTTGTPTFTLTFLFGSTVIVASSPVASGAGQSSGAFLSYGPVKLVVRTIGATGSMNGGGLVNNGGNYDDLSTGPTTTPPTGSDVGSINFNQANLIDFQCACSAASASNTIQILGFSARLRG